MFASGAEQVLCPERQLSTHGVLRRRLLRPVLVPRLAELYGVAPSRRAGIVIAGGLRCPPAGCKHFLHLEGLRSQFGLFLNLGNIIGIAGMESLVVGDIAQRRRFHQTRDVVNANDCTRSLDEFLFRHGGGILHL